MTAKRRNRISQQFAVRLIEMLESPAWRMLSLSGRRVIERIEIELAHHGGNDNGKLPVPYNDFVSYGIDRDAVAPALREAEALGFIKVTQRGRGGNAEHRQPNLFFLTFGFHRDTKSNPPTDDWRKIKTAEEAAVIARTARANKDMRAVDFGHRRFKNRSGKPRLNPVGKTPTGNRNFSVGKTPTTGSVGKPRLLSISRGGGALRTRGDEAKPSERTEGEAGADDQAGIEAAAVTGGPSNPPPIIRSAGTQR